MGEVIKHNFLSNDWCVPERCPCLTCKYFWSEKIDAKCACKPCNQKGLRRPEDVLCYKTSDGKYGYYDLMGFN
jgi:hypothetical protein